MNGVILDCDSLGPDSLDLSPMYDLPINWTSYQDCPDRQATAATSSGDAECIEWSGTAKDALRMSEMLDYTRMSNIDIFGYTDNDATRL